MEQVVIPVNDYLESLLNEVNTERFQKATDKNSDFRAGALFGLSWAGIMTSQTTQYVVDVPE